MNNTILKTKQRIGFKRYFLLLCVISIVAVAFWDNTERQLAIVMESKYIVHGDSFLTKEEEKAFTKTLALFPSGVGIEAELYFQKDSTVRKKDTALVFVVNPLYKKGFIEYPKILETFFSAQEKRLLDEAMEQALQQKEWQASLLAVLEDVYNLLRDGDSSQAKQ